MWGKIPTAKRSVRSGGQCLQNDSVESRRQFAVVPFASVTEALAHTDEREIAVVDRQGETTFINCLDDYSNGVQSLEAGVTQLARRCQPAIVHLSDEFGTDPDCALSLQAGRGLSFCLSGLRRPERRAS
jgi:hypothetical protein